MYSCAASGFAGLAQLGSVNMLCMLISTVQMLWQGDHLSCNVSCNNHSIPAQPQHQPQLVVLLSQQKVPCRLQPEPVTNEMCHADCSLSLFTNDMHLRLTCAGVARQAGLSPPPPKQHPQDTLRQQQCSPCRCCHHCRHCNNKLHSTGVSDTRQCQVPEGNVDTHKCQVQNMQQLALLD